MSDDKQTDDNKPKDDGGPAFPVGLLGGMSLRDWFAGQALAGITTRNQLTGETICDKVRWCYQYADRMLAERKKQ